MFRAFLAGDPHQSADSRAGDHSIPNERPRPSSSLSMWQRLGNAMTPMWKKMGQAVSPQVVRPTEKSRGWTTGGVISTFELTHYERVRLNAMEERVLPPEVRIKIVFAQATAGDREDEIEAKVLRLDGLVRTLALYGILERNALDSSKSEKLAPDRELQLGKMLVAAVQLELFQMLDEICEAGHVENDLFDDLCSDAIQEGRRAGFFHLSPDLLLAPGSGYKRLLQIRKDQIVEDIANASGLRAFAGYDCQREPSPPSSPRLDGRMKIECASEMSKRGLACLTGLKIGGSASGSTNADAVAPSPSSQVPEWLSPSPSSGHHRSQTQRVRDLLLSIDGLMMESEKPEPEEALVSLPPVSPEGVDHYDVYSSTTGGLDRRNKRRSTGGVDGRGERSGRFSLRTPPYREADEPEGPSPGKRSFFHQEKRWSVPFTVTPPLDMAINGSSAARGAAEGAKAEGVEFSDKLLAEVDWLIAGTEAALGGVTPERVDAENATVSKFSPAAAEETREGGTFPAKAANGYVGATRSLDGTNAHGERGNGQSTEQVSGKAEGVVETATIAEDAAGVVVVEEKDAKTPEGGLSSYLPDASTTDVSLNTVPSPGARGSDGSLTDGESRLSEAALLAPGNGDVAPVAEDKKEPITVQGQPMIIDGGMVDSPLAEGAGADVTAFSVDAEGSVTALFETEAPREAMAVMPLPGDAVATASSVGLQSVERMNALDGAEGENGRQVMRTIRHEKGRGIVTPTADTIVKAAGGSGTGGLNSGEGKKLAPAKTADVLEILPQSGIVGEVGDLKGALTQAKNTSPPPGQPGAYDSDADEGDFGLPKAALTSSTAAKAPLLVDEVEPGDE